MPKQTPDLVALILACIVAAVTLLTALTLLFVSVVRPEQDVSRAAEAIGNILGVLIAALVGYLAGRRVSNGNGTH